MQNIKICEGFIFSIDRKTQLLASFVKCHNLQKNLQDSACFPLLKKHPPFSLAVSAKPLPTQEK
jgi:hypothetical protein